MVTSVSASRYIFPHRCTDFCAPNGSANDVLSFSSCTKTNNYHKSESVRRALSVHLWDRVKAIKNIFSKPDLKFEKLVTLT